MRTFLVYGFWIWLCISVAVIIWRRLDKTADPSDASTPAVPAAAAPPASAAPPTPTAPTSHAAEPVLRPMQTLAALTADPADQPTSDVAMADELDETQLLPAVAAARRAELGLPPLPRADESDASPDREATPTVPDGPVDTTDPEMLQPSVAAAMREQTIAGAAPSPATRGLFDAAAVGTLSVPLTESLAGISMPLGLAPLTNVGEHEAPDNTRERLTVWTAEGTANQVAAAVATELARLGHTLTPLDSSSAVARRGHEVVEIRIYQDPESVLAHEGMMFPTAPPKSVVVDFLAG